MLDQDQSPPSMEDLRKQRLLKAVNILLGALAEPEGEIHKQRTRDLYVYKLVRTLSETERTLWVLLLLETFPPDLAEQVVTAIFDGAGWPTTGLERNFNEDAELWVATASQDEIRAYARACMARLSKTERAAAAKWLEKHGG